MKNSVHSSRHNLTEHKTKFIQASPYILALYNSLCPTLCKTCHIIFNKILQNKRYKTYKKNYENALTEIDEDRRIYSDVDMTPATLLLESNSIKYANGGNPETDCSNFKKILKELHDNNVFYMWVFSKQYMFFLERDFGSWKYFNSIGYVTPHTLKKIICCSDSAVSTMCKLKGKINTEALNIVGESFCNFISDIIKKMNPSIIKKIPLWEKGKYGTMVEYINKLKESIELLDGKEGLIEANDFLNKLPPYVRGALEMRRSKMEIESELANDIIPDNPNLSKVKTQKTIKIESNKTDNSNNNFKEGITPKMLIYEDTIDPFTDSIVFTKYYRSFINKGTNKLVLNHIETDVIWAGKILDLLKENNRKDKQFLNSWMKYYYDKNLKGAKSKDASFTSLKSFLNSFQEYNVIYYDPQKVV